MVVLISPESPFFDCAVAKELFALNQKAIEDQRGFESYLTPWFFNVYEGGKFVGCIFCYHQDGRDWVGGFAKRRTHHQCLEALNQVKVYFPELYAQTKQRSAKFISKKAGFEEIENNILVYRRK